MNEILGKNIHINILNCNKYIQIKFIEITKKDYLKKFNNPILDISVPYHRKPKVISWSPMFKHWLEIKKKYFDYPRLSNIKIKKYITENNIFVSPDTMNKNIEDFNIKDDINNNIYIKHINAIQTELNIYLIYDNTYYYIDNNQLENDIKEL